MSKDVLELRKKAKSFFGVREFFSCPQQDEEGQAKPHLHWVLSGGRLGHLALWSLDTNGGGVDLVLKKVIHPPGDTSMETVQRILLPPPEWSCWRPDQRKTGFLELVVLLLGRRELHQGSTIYSLQLHPQTGKVFLNPKRMHHWVGVSPSSP